MVLLKNICDYNKAEYAWVYGIPYIKNATRTPCDKNKSPKEGSNYCEEHGCPVCNYSKLKYKYEDPSLDIKLDPEVGGKSVCSVECQKKANTDYFWEAEKNKEAAEDKKEREEIASLAQEKYKSLKEEIRNICPSFYEQINTLNLGKLKGDFIKREISEQKLIDNSHLIIQNSPLESVEKSQWKNIYSKSDFKTNLALVVIEERNLLLSLAKQRRKLREQEEQIELERVVGEIKKELNYCTPNAPKVELKDLPATYHNYEALGVQHLKKTRGDIIKAIKIERERKKLSNLLDKATACIDNDLHNFFQQLEKFASNYASQYEKAAYLLLKNKVDAVINDLQKRLNNLDEETRLSFCWDNACHNFDNWIREGENLVLSDNCPFRDFKESVKKIRNESEIKNCQGQAFQHIIEKFKKNVKEQIGAEEWDNEFQEIDNSKDFFEVKLARDNIQQDRKKSLEEFIEGAINKLQNLLDSNQEVNLSEIVLPTWKEDLRGLKNKGKVSAFVKKMEEEISNASHNKQEKSQEESRTNFSNWLLLHWKIVGIIVVFGSFLVISIIYWMKKRRRLVLKP